MFPKWWEATGIVKARRTSPNPRLPSVFWSAVLYDVAMLFVSSRATAFKPKASSNRFPRDRYGGGQYLQIRTTGRAIGQRISPSRSEMSRSGRQNRGGRSCRRGVREHSDPRPSDGRRISTGLMAFAITRVGRARKNRAAPTATVMSDLETYGVRRGFTPKVVSRRMIQMTWEHQRKLGRSREGPMFRIPG